MKIILTPGLQQFVTSQVELGHYYSPTDVVEAALRLLQRQAEKSHAAEAHATACPASPIDWGDIHAGNEIFRRVL